MTGAPTWVEDSQLSELGIGLTAQARARQEQATEAAE
jgi:hypothetical protein